MNKFKFRTSLGEDVFYKRYALNGDNDSWPLLSRRVVDSVCGSIGGSTSALMSKPDRDQLIQYITDMKFIPGGRYLYYAGRGVKFYNNCYCLKAEEDTREEWAELNKRATLCLMTGGGIGIDYSILRPSGHPLSRSGGQSSGPIPLMHMMNEVGRNVMQGGTRRSAMWAGLNWQHEDIEDFMYAKDWSPLVTYCKSVDTDFPAPLDMTNLSILWDTKFHTDYVLEGSLPDLWFDSVKRMCSTGEPGHCYNFYKHENETLRNACTEFISDRDSDVCNLGSINLANIIDLKELSHVVTLASQFLVCGTLRADLPYDKVRQVRNEYRKIGLGLMGVHEWLLQRGYDYSVVDELAMWLDVYASVSESAANSHADRFFIARPRNYRAIAPAGTIGLLAGTTTGIEPIYTVAYKRKYLRNNEWVHQYVVDATARSIIENKGINPDNIETAMTLARNVEKRIKFQCDIQKYVDMGISSTVNLPAWGSEFNNEDTAITTAHILAKYCTGLRGITFYPDAALASQPITEVPYSEALAYEGKIYEESMDSCKGGVCGI